MRLEKKHASEKRRSQDGGLTIITSSASRASAPIAAGTGWSASERVEGLRSGGRGLPRRVFEGRRNRIGIGTERPEAGRGLGRTALSPTTTYATTYGWVSAGIRRELIAPPPSEMRLDGTKRDPTGLNL